MFFECNTNVKQMLRFVFAYYINSPQFKTHVTHLYTTPLDKTGNQHTFTHFVLSPVSS